MHEDDASEQTYLTPDEVGRITRTGSDAVTRWIRTGKLPAFRTPGGRYLIAERDIARALRPVGKHQSEVRS